MCPLGLVLWALSLSLVATTFYVTLHKESYCSPSSPDFCLLHICDILSCATMKLFSGLASLAGIHIAAVAAANACKQIGALCNDRPMLTICYSVTFRLPASASWLHQASRMVSK